MQDISYYTSPVGTLLLAADSWGLTGIWFQGQKGYPLHLEKQQENGQNPLLTKTKKWLDMYFSGKNPDVQVPLHPGGTAFQRQVWDILTTIPYGKTRTYGNIANQLARQRGLKNMAPQAVGAAVGRNPLSIIVPCHRVIGAKGQLTGYAGGLERKAQLLSLEQTGTWGIPENNKGKQEGFWIL